MNYSLLLFIDDLFDSVSVILKFSGLNGTTGLKIKPGLQKPIWTGDLFTQGVLIGLSDLFGPVTLYMILLAILIG